MPENWRDHATFVPIPPSKVKRDAEHDPRLRLTLQAVTPRLRDIRELVLRHENGDAKRKGMSPAERAQNYYINEGLAVPEPNAIFIFDDVLTTGCHYKAIEIILRNRFPNAQLCGLFLARAVRPPHDNDENLLAFL